MRWRIDRYLRCLNCVCVCLMFNVFVCFVCDLLCDVVCFVFFVCLCVPVCFVYDYL